MFHYNVQQTKKGTSGKYKLSDHQKILRVGRGERRLTEARMQVLSLENEELLSASLDKSETLKSADIIKRFLGSKRVHNYIIRNAAGEPVGKLALIKANTKKYFSLSYLDDVFCIFPEKGKENRLTVCQEDKTVAWLERQVLYDNSVVYEITMQTQRWMDELFLFIIYYDLLCTSLNLYLTEKSLLPQPGPRPVEVMTGRIEKNKK